MEAVLRVITLRISPSSCPTIAGRGAQEAFCADVIVPVRQHYTIPRPGEDARPAADAGMDGSGCGVRRLQGRHRISDNAALGQPALYGSYLPLSGETGEPLATLDGRVLTHGARRRRPRLLPHPRAPTHVIS